MNLRLEKIHKDGRGEIYTLVGNSLKESEEITIFTTNKGYARGGCIHRLNDEFCCVLEGDIEYRIGKKLKVMSKGDICKVPKNTPHYYYSVVDSIVAEWGATVPEKREKHDGFRRIVDRINARN